MGSRKRKKKKTPKGGNISENIESPAAPADRKTRTWMKQICFSWCPFFKNRKSPMRKRTIPPGSGAISEKQNRLIPDRTRKIKRTKAFRAKTWDGMMDCTNFDSTSRENNRLTREGVLDSRLLWINVAFQLHQ